VIAGSLLPALPVAPAAGADLTEISLAAIRAALHLADPVLAGVQGAADAGEGRVQGGALVQLAYLASAVLFILGLKQLSHPATARRGNALASLGMLVAVVTTLLGQEILDFTWILVGGLGGAAIGAWLARTVEMTAMPQMVAVFNGFGGGASALVAAAEFLKAGGAGAGAAAGAGAVAGAATGLGAALPLETGISIMVGTLIGGLTFSGSWVAFAKLQGKLEGAITYPLQKTANFLILLATLAGATWLALTPPAGSETLYLGLALLALLLGVLVVIPIGGADMPVVVALLNSYSGLAASAAGFVLANMALIVSGALVGASGLILTAIMCRAMNRPLTNVLFGAFGGGGGPTADREEGERHVNQTDAENAAMMMAYARQVVIVPGYGLAVAQAQHKLRELADQLQARGVKVKYAIHPVAGRMPGHMNVLLAEADVPYDQLFEPEDVNPEMPQTDVALVVGANDVTNPAARDDPSSPIAGMPIVEVDRAKNCIVLKRSLSTGFAGIDNELFYGDETWMFFGDAAETIPEMVQEIKEL